MKIKMMDMWMQIEGTKLIFFMNFSVLHFFNFASRLAQIAQILISTFKIFWALEIFFVLFSLAIRGFDLSFILLAEPVTDEVQSRFCLPVDCSNTE